MTNEDSDSILMYESMRRDERLTIEVFDAVSDPQWMIHILLKKLQLYNETEVVLKESRNKLVVGFMKVAVENGMMTTQIKNDLNRQVEELAKRMEKLEVRND
jgi:hypothetical protein